MLTMNLQFFAHKKGMGSTKNGRDSESKRLGAKRADGQFVKVTADPEKDPAATKFDKITYDEIYNRGLKVMDLTATTMCKENRLPIIVFNMDQPGNLKKVILGENIGTIVY